MNEDPQRLELFYLMECAESPFGLGRADDHRWNAEHPGESATTDLILELERRGCLIVVEKYDEEAQRLIAQAEITDAGRKRMNELVIEGVEPSEGWL